MFKNTFSFSGRIRRTEFCLSYIIVMACFGLLNYVVMSEGMTFILIAYIPILWFYIAQATKRCHDRGNIGLFMLIPFYGFWMLFADSDHGMNKYGPNPKGIGNIDEVDEIGNYLQEESRVQKY